MTEHEILVQGQASQTLELADEARRLLWNRPWQKANAARLSLLVRGRPNQVAPPEQYLLEVVYLLGSETNTELNIAEETQRTVAKDNPGAAETLQFLLDEVKIRQSVVAARSAQGKGDYRNAAEQFREAWRTRLAAECRIPEGEIDHPWWDIAELYSDQKAALVEAYGLPKAEAARLVDLKAEMEAMYRRHAMETEPLDLIQHAIRHARWGNRPLVKEALEWAERWSEGADPVFSLAQQMSQLLPLWVDLEDRLWQSPEQPEAALRAHATFAKSQDRQSLQRQSEFPHRGVSDQLSWLVSPDRSDEAVNEIRQALRLYLLHHSEDGGEQLETRLHKLVNKDWHWDVESVFKEVAEIQKNRARFYREFSGQELKVFLEDEPLADLCEGLAVKYANIEKAIRNAPEHISSADQTGEAAQTPPLMGQVEPVSPPLGPAKNTRSTSQPTPRSPESDGLQTGRQKLLAGQYEDAIKELALVLGDVSAGRSAARLLVIAKSCRAALQQGTPLSPNQIQYLVEAADDLETDTGLEIAQAKLEAARADFLVENSQPTTFKPLMDSASSQSASDGQSATSDQPKAIGPLAGLTLLEKEIVLRRETRALIAQRMADENGAKETKPLVVRPLISAGKEAAKNIELEDSVWKMLYEPALKEYTEQRRALGQVRENRGFEPEWYQRCRKLLDNPLASEESPALADSLELQKTAIALAMIKQWLPTPTSDTSQHQRLSDDDIQAIRKEIEDARWSLIENALADSMPHGVLEGDEQFLAGLDNALTQFICLYWDAGDETTGRLRTRLETLTDELEYPQAEDPPQDKPLGEKELQKMRTANTQVQRRLLTTSSFVHIYEIIDEMQQESKS